MLQPGLLTLQLSKAAQQCLAGAGELLLMQIQLMEAACICLVLQRGGLCQTLPIMHIFTWARQNRYMHGIVNA